MAYFNEKKSKTGSMIKVAMVEDDVGIRQAIETYLSIQSNIQFIAAVDSVELMLESLDQKKIPDIILMDIQLPGMSGIDGIRKIKKSFSEIDIIMLTIYHDEEKIFQSLCAGASGYLLKNTPLDELKEAVETLYLGGAPMSPQIARKVIHYFNPKQPIGDPAELTAKERQVVQALVDGLSYKMISDQMAVSIDTVRFHIKNIYKKLHVNSKGEVVSRFMKGQI